MKRTIILLSILVLAGSLAAQQASYTFSSPTSGVYVARDYIRLLPGFHCSASSGSFRATIDPTLVINTLPTITPTPLAASCNHNYIVTTIATKAVADASSFDDNNSNTTIQYFDGLGRLEQTVQKAVTPQGNDLVSGVVYDPFGRESQKWLPGMATGNGGAYVAGYASLAQGSNGGDDHPYATTNYEASPLNRPTEQYGPGADWYSNTKRKVIEYTTNGSDVKLFYVENDQLKCRGTYDAATLYGQKTTDEDGKWMEEFTDKLGRKVLSRTYDVSGGNHDTYYVYDDLDNLRYVLPPLAADALGSGNYDNNADALVKYAYLYAYDGRKRCISKRLPGCGWIYMAYDKSDRLVMSQDGNQRAKSPAQWTVNKYDVFGRLLYSGLVNDNRTGSQMATDCAGLLFTETTGSSTVPGYTSNNITPSTLLTVNYYDNYSFVDALDEPTKTQLTAIAKDGYTAPDKDHVKTMLTGTRVYHLDDPNKAEVTALYYDKYGRTVQTRASNHLSGYDITYNEIDFTGKPNKTLKTHGISGNSVTYTELYTYTYDHAQRLLTTTHSLNGATPVTLVSNSYDPLGRLQTKTLGGVDASSYTYNVRSWISGISGNRFTENLYYNQNTANLANFTASYNGNIAGMQWSVSAEGLGYNRAYSFAYDGLNRLTAGNYTGGTAGAYNEAFAYDKMGNITMLNRNESGTGLNQLTLNYTGNQLLTAYDALSVTKLYGSEAFDNKANLSTEYLYDTNGSTTYDANSGISTIQYNVLNLPNIVQFTAGHKNIYTYGADGKKLETNNYTLHSAINVPQGSISTLPSNAGDYTKVTTDYVGNMIYENGTLKEILLPEGYWQNGTYYYYLKDHLGDNRVTINSSGSIIEKSHYYPSGMRFFPESSSNSAALPYRYNGKELETMNGLNQYDYGARRRGAGLPMWTAVDPLAEKNPWMSPYAYCSDNPMNRIDPDGRIDWWAVGEGALNTIGGGLQMFAGATTSWTGVGVGLIITGMAQGSCGLAQLTCGLVSDNSKQSQQTLKDMPKGVGSIAGEVAAEATGNKNVRTAFEVGESVLAFKFNPPTKLLEAGVFVGQTAFTVKNTIESNSTKEDKNNTTAKADKGQAKSKKSTSSQQPSQEIKVPLKPAELKIPSLLDMVKR